MIKKSLFVLVSVFLAIGLMACGSETTKVDDDQSVGQTEESEKEVETEEEAVEEKEELSVDDVISAFAEAGLEAENPKEMTRDDYGMAPMKAIEAKRFLIPSIGEDAGGRIFSFDNDEDLQQTKAYYDDLGKESAMLFSHTAFKENILVQVNGDLEDEKFEEYKGVLESLKE